MGPSGWRTCVPDSVLWPLVFCGCVPFLTTELDLGVVAVAAVAAVAGCLFDPDVPTEATFAFGAGFAAAIYFENPKRLP